MVKSIFIALFLFSASLSFGQNSANDDKKITSTLVNTRAEGNQKKSVKDESVGTKPIDVSTTEDPAIVPYNPLSERSSKENTDNSKNNSKPQ